jgi:hypothetical protein
MPWVPLLDEEEVVDVASLLVSEPVVVSSEDMVTAASELSLSLVGVGSEEVGEESGWVVESGCCEVELSAPVVVVVVVFEVLVPTECDVELLTSSVVVSEGLP